jgi:SWI/SNF-related matrix-associated actin-dependent regulator 1 of chromatin subfamily A
MPSQPPGQPAPRAPASNEAFHRPGTVLGAGGPPAGSAIAAPESEDDGEAVTRVGKLPPEIVRSAQAQQPQRAAPPAAQPPAQQPQRKPARRRTLSRGETSPLAQGRRATHDGRDSRHDNRDSRSQHEGRASHAQHDPRAAQAAPAADPRKARSAPLPSEVPTAPGNDARAGAARAAALRALQLQDDEVTAQRDVAVLQRLKDLKDLAVDDLDEDTSVLPGLKVKEAVAAAVASKEAAAKQERRLEDELTRRGLDPRELTKQAPAASAAHAYGGSPDDDRPTPTEHDADFSATSPPDTSRTSTAGVEAAALAAETGRYSAIDALWATNDARGGRTATVHNPAASAQAAAADAAAVAAAAAAARQEATTITPMIAPMCAFRVAVLRPDASGAARVVALAPGAPLPAGAVGAMLVPTTEAESAELARIFGYVG